MKAKIYFVLNLLWCCMTAFVFPAFLGILYADITGHGKGYDYDLGSEKDISIMFGFVELIVFLLMTLPSLIYVVKRTIPKGKLWLLAELLVFLILGLSCIVFVIGGFKEYLTAFGIGI